MNKSIIIFLGLLVILLPVGSSLKIPNANAIADFDKGDRKQQVSVSSLKCNNINVNVNGLELSVLPPFLGGGDLAAEAVGSNTDPSSFAAGNNEDGLQFNDFRFICINNNNNTVIEAEEPIPPTPPVDPCEECFIQTLNSTQFAALEFSLDNGIFIAIGQESRTIHSLAEICEIIQGDNPEVARALILTLSALINDTETFNELVICLRGLADGGQPPDRGPIIVSTQ
ncbi:MAG TPA: hypothetical protein VFM31_05430 [Nitrososphaeraceae archaeon]|nr:hypothetical protein [Nitrososphaeraceae archaeon]